MSAFNKLPTWGGTTWVAAHKHRLIIDRDDTHQLKINLNGTVRTLLTDSLAQTVSGVKTFTGFNTFSNSPTGGDSGFGTKFTITPVAGTAGLRQGGLDIDLTRAVGAALTAWDGNPDTAINVKSRNNAVNSSGGGVRAIDASARNDGTQTWVKTLDVGGRNSSGATLTDSIVVGHLRAENYGTVTTDIVGFDIEMSDENNAGSAHANAGLVIRNTDASGMPVVREAVRLSHGASSGAGGFGALFNFDGITATSGTMTQAITGAATTIAYQLRCIMPNGAAGYVNVYSTTGT